MMKGMLKRYTKDYCLFSSELLYYKNDYQLQTTNIVQVNKYCSNSKSDQSYYDILQISPDATDKEVKSAYLSLSKQNHPDSDRNDPSLHNKFISINKAYTVLSDPSSRQDYNFSLGIISKNINGDNYRPGEHFRSIDFFGDRKYTSASSTGPDINNQPINETRHSESYSNESQKGKTILSKLSLHGFLVFLFLYLFFIGLLIILSRKGSQNDTNISYSVDNVLWHK